MKNFLLVVPQFVTKSQYYGFPLGLAYISSYLKKNGFNVFCLNLCHFDKSTPIEEIIKKHIEEYKIDIFCTGAMSWYWNEVDAMLKIAKKIKPDITTIVGGALVTADPELALKNLDIDIGVMGEAEKTMLELAKTLCENKNFEQIKGIAFIKNDELIITPRGDYIENLDALSFPDYEGFGFKEWSPLIFRSGNMDILNEIENLHYAEIIGSRSCPFSCTFCYHPLGQKYRQRSLDNIFKEIDHLVSTYKINFILFLDELFSANHQRMIKFAELIKPYNIGWAGSFRVNDVNPEILKTLKQSGLKYIGYGIENINDEILISMKKKATSAQNENALKLTREAGISCAANIIFGDPAETEKTVKNSLNWWLKNPQYNISLVPLKVLPDSPIYQYAIKNNLISDKLKFAQQRFPIINLTKMSDKKFYKWLSRLSMMTRSKKQIPHGKIIGSAKLNKNAEEKKLYSIKIRCPFCQHDSQYEKVADNSLYAVFNCQNCWSRNKILSYKIFSADHNFFEAILKHFSLNIRLYLARFAFYRRNNKWIDKKSFWILARLKKLIR